MVSKVFIARSNQLQQQKFSSAFAALRRFTSFENYAEPNPFGEKR